MTTAATASEPYSMPAQIQRQAEAMEAFDAQVLADQTAAALAAEAPPTPPVAAAPALVEPVVPVAAPTPPPADQPWEQRYRSLQGMFDQQAAKLVELTALVAANAKPAPVPEPKAPKPSAVTPADTEAFGADLMDVIKRQATEIAEQLVAPTQAQLTEALAENARLKGQVEGVAGRQQKSDGDTYLAEFAKSLPSWETQNNDPTFLAWLAEADPLSGVRRQEYMDRAVATFNVKQTVALFTSWPGHVATAPTPALTPTPPPPPVPAPKPSVTPSSTKVDATPPATPEVATWSMDAITQFYADCGRGKYRTDPAEQARIEAEIDLAVQNNRLKP